MSRGFCETWGFRPRIPTISGERVILSEVDGSRSGLSAQSKACPERSRRGPLILRCTGCSARHSPGMLALELSEGSTADTMSFGRWLYASVVCTLRKPRRMRQPHL
jgi:hypothetical protein